MKRIPVTLLFSLTLCASSAWPQNSEPASATRKQGNEIPFSSFNPTDYVRVSGKDGISIDIPKDWKVMSAREISEVKTTHPTMTPDRQPQIRIFANATRLTSGAVISVSVIERPNWTQAKLDKTTDNELMSVNKQMQEAAQGKPSQSGIGTVSVGPEYKIIQRQGINGKIVTISYAEAETRPNGNKITWLTQHTYIPHEKREIEVITSFHERHAMFWGPVMQRMTNSLSF